MYVSDVSKEHLSVIVDSACLVNLAVHERYLKVEFPNLDIGDELRDINTPVLFLNGAKDNVIPLQPQHETALNLPNFKEVIFSDEGHMLPLESPKRASIEIISFYKNDLIED